MAPTLKDLLASPDNYLHSFQGDAAIFMPMDRAAYHRSIFLDARVSPAANRPTRVAVGDLAAALLPRSSTGWIFHVAHCGSTLLARALDQVHTNLVLREPLALRQLAIANDRERLAIVAAMLSRRYQANLPTIVKANVPVNFLLPDLIGFDASARSIFLYLGLRDYLLAILRDDGHREWLRRVTTQLSAHLGDLTALSDAERAAMLWAAQMEAFAAAIARLPTARTIDGEAFFAAPRDFIKLTADHLQVPMTEGEIDAIVAGPLFATYAKNPNLAFNNELRSARRSDLERSLAPELELAQKWVAKNGGAKKALKVIAAAALNDPQDSAAPQAAAAAVGH
jgi:hypothetical protein